ncbi:kinesin-like protein KIN-14F [Impatiens glandulifera]|uniref:kinesin-like protein KIN-14F n=1 Tax=Impatiens glandulifera TaxID=253017 RepID=UPI001FB11133|nr:kinesin-like protein KIN-14F [Impatiens glandulifera]
METEEIPPSEASVVVAEEIVQPLVKQDSISKKTEEFSERRYEAARWLRKTVGVVGGKDLPAEPSEEGFRIGLRRGTILCNVLNKVTHGAIPKVVDTPLDSATVPDGATLSSFQYYENIKNFIINVEEMGLPAFEVSDLEQGGKISRVVNCVLALKAYSDRKQIVGSRSMKVGGNTYQMSSAKQLLRKGSEPFMSTISRNWSSEKFLDSLNSEQSSYGDLDFDLNEMGNSHSLHTFVSDLLSDKKPEEIPLIVENMLGKVMEEYEIRLASQKEWTKQSIPREIGQSNSNSSQPMLHSFSEETTVKPSIPQERRVSDSIPRRLILNSSEETGVSDSIPSLPILNSSEEISVRSPISGETNASDSQPNHLMTYSSQENAYSFDMIIKKENKAVDISLNLDYLAKKNNCLQISRDLVLKQQLMVEQQQRDVKKIKFALQTTKVDMQSLQTKYQEEMNNLGKHMKRLAHAASAYQKVLEENRKLYNQIQDLKGNIRVYCRVRPFLPGQANGVTTVDSIDEGSITIGGPSKIAKAGRKSFTFNRVFGPGATQAEVFSDTQPLIRSVLDGYNVCIFAYGQTGSGKTHTMTGPKELTEEGLGVNYRALSDLFNISEQRKNTIAYEVSVQMIEIYNEQVRDLLVTDGSNKKIEIRNTGQKGNNIPDATRMHVSSTDDVLNFMTLGHKNRTVSATAMNDRSSRSHSCLTVHVQGKDQTSGTLSYGCMHLVDLAGSERVDKSEVVGAALKEAQHINKSLAALGDVISSLAQKNSHVPYRNSKLTQLLQDSLGGQAKTLMFVHISPEPDATSETLSTLKFAERVSTIELGAARSNKEGSDVKELKEQVLIASLKAALARGDGEAGYLQQPGSGSSERSKLKPNASPSLSRSSSSMSAGQRQLMDDAGHIEVRNQLGLKEHEKDGGGGFGDWVDKAMVNKQGGCLDNNWEDDNGKHGEDGMSNSSRVGSSRSETAMNDDSEDFDAATSDSSETDSFAQLIAPKASSSTLNGTGTKAKKPNPKQLASSKSQDRSQIPAPPTRKPSSGQASPLHKSAAKPHAVSSKKPGGGK